MQNRIIEWFQEDQFASANLNRVELFEIKGKRTLSLKNSVELPSQVSCISCSTSRGGVAVGQQSGNVSFVNGDSTTAVVIYDSSSARRPCTAVSWNKLNPTQLAAGFEKSRSQGEFCAVVCDVEGSTGSAGKVLFRPLSEEPTASICWLDAHVLVVGTSISWVRLYDVRISAGQQGQGQGGEIMSIMAHAATRPRKVKGSRCDQLQQHTIATFSDSPGEPIKIWDLRKAGVSAKPKLMIVQSQLAAVVDIAWSAARAGVLAVATNQSRNINFYSTIRPVTELVSRTPFHTITLADPVKSLTWKTGSGSRLGSRAIGGQMQALNLETVANGSNTGSINNKRNNMEATIKDADSLRSNRLLVATTAGFADMDVIESVGLGQGARGFVAVGAGKHMDIVNTSNWGLNTWTDIETLMGTRCTAGYSIDAGKNLQVLSEEMDTLMAFRTKELRLQAFTSPATDMTEMGVGSLESLSVAPAAAHMGYLQTESSESTSQKDSEDSAFIMSSSASSSIPSDTRQLSRQVQLFALSRLWAWVDRVESLSNESLSVSSCGVINLLTSSTQSTACSMHTELGVMVYFSENRNLAKELCGWTGMVLDGTAELQQPGGHVTTLPNMKSKVVERSKSRATSSDYSHDSLITGGNKSQGSGDDEANDSASDKGQKGVSLKGSKKRSEKDSLSSSSVGFDPLSELEEMVAECEETDCFERAAAVALFHGNLTLAVRILQKHIPVSGRTQKSGGSSGAVLGYDKSGDSAVPSTHLRGVKESSSIAAVNGNSGDALAVVNVDITDVSEGEEASHVITSNSTVAQQSTHALKSDAQYTQLISLTAMCIAGFSNDSRSSLALTLSPQQEMWASMCRHVVTQLELQTEIENEQRISSCCYLAAALRFLLNALSDIHADQTKSSTSTFHSKGVAKRSTDTGVAGVKYGCVVNDHRLSLQDRVAFALTFLDDRQTLEWMQGVKDDCTRRGDLAGLVVTGLSREGLDLLQQYLDRHDDLQTVALLVGRNVIDNAAANAAASASSGSTEVGGPSSSQVKSRERQWLWEYRNLLNKMQLFIGRASLDVQLGRRNRLIVRPGPTAAVGDVTSSSARSGSTGNIPYGQGKLRQSQPPGAAGRGSGSAIDRKSGSARVLYQLPPHSDLTHVFLRCNYCSSSLPVDPMQQQQAAFFRKQRPLINCCANCKKPLPRCYVCLLYMGLVNPTHEFNRALVQKRKASAELALISSGNPESSVSLTAGHSEETPHNVLAFGQWFFFCQHCKHGGHAACIDDWFEGEDKSSRKSNGRDVCGVNGCLCHCRSLK